ncbi:regucalcin-like isoform X2 [Neocloeon triangulifer]|nr:regucalcin-like isoform X2 [Neocloeon triangulifer]XP_059481971.1 regucalcin-like isoform X2 [Neocloeon triangulifer]
MSANPELAGAVVEAVEAAGVVQLGEGPHWVDSEQALYWVDLLAGVLHRLHPSTGKHTSTTPPGSRPMGFVVPVFREPGHFVVGHGTDLSLLSWDGQTQCKIVKVLGSVAATPGTLRFNDGKADPQGRLWAGTMSTVIDKGNEAQPEIGALYSLENNGAKKHVDYVGISNGLAWRDALMYYIDSTAERVDAFDLEPASGHLSERRCIFDFKKNNIKGVPDGMTIDSIGNLWIACFGGNQVICIDPERGQLLRKVPIPASQVTSVCWGGRLLDELFVTTAGVKSEAGKSEAGRLYRVTGLGANGLLNDQVRLPAR